MPLCALSLFLMAALCDEPGESPSFRGLVTIANESSEPVLVAWCKNPMSIEAALYGTQGLSIGRDIIHPGMSAKEYCGGYGSTGVHIMVFKFSTLQRPKEELVKESFVDARYIVKNEDLNEENEYTIIYTGKESAE